MHIILDTNILLLEASNLLTIAKEYNDATIVLPETVLDEVDSKKSGHTEIAFQARAVGRLLASAEEKGTVTANGVTTTSLLLENVKIDIISVETYPQFKDSASNILSDRKIIHVASLYPDSLFISNDVMCRIRATSLGIKASDYKVVSNLALEFVKELEVTPTVFSVLHNMDITVANPDHKPENYNYVFIDTFSGQRKLGTLTNNIIQIIGKETEREIRAQDFAPINSGQLFLSKAILDTNIDLVVCEAKAGTGKTATAISNAIKLVRDNKTPYDSIIYIRSSIDDLDKSEEIGFLSGNDEKVNVYIQPLEDTLEAIVRNRHKAAKGQSDEIEKKISEGIEKLRSQCNIQGIITLGLRGRTLRNSVVIIDEVGNLSKASLQKVLTRIGENCKVILIGSNKQIDNPFLNKYTNGLSVILDACRTTHEKVRLHAVTLPKVVRGHIAEFAENLFSKD